MHKKKAIWVSALTVTGVAIATAGVGMAWADTSKPGHASAKAGCELTVLSDDLGSAQGVSASGEYVAGSTYAYDPGNDGAGDSKPVVWRDGKPTEFMSKVQNVIPKAKSAVAGSVNSSGTAVGTTDPEDGSGYGSFRYQDGKAVALKAPKGYEQSSATFIDDDGTAAGTVTRSSDNVAVAATWAPDSDTATLVGGPDDIAVTSLGDDGTVYGYTDPYNSPKMWAISKDGKSQQIEIKDANSIVQDYVSFPVVNGDWMLADEFRWNRADGSEPTVHEITAKNDDGSVTGKASAIDGKGRVYGVDADGKPEMGADGEVTPLPVGDGDFKMVNPEDASSDGHVVVGNALRGDDESAVTVAYMWTCEV
ncbi:MAG TPA: hypothetical protein VE172_04660 [Stackebrandtia sp.]|uniref:hypothetical protein n=1 Tax=Stackebrandtia sp. TaxID=2023065 RepID=UPI002D6143A0|nr:hypothetical protein [Stackebrandtia sp.]HZE38085.1 hypothetical protein [Stackebrandtia sp.]